MTKKNPAARLTAHLVTNTLNSVRLQLNICLCACSLQSAFSHRQSELVRSTFIQHNLRFVLRYTCTLFSLAVRLDLDCSRVRILWQNRSFHNNSQKTRFANTKHVLIWNADILRLCSLLHFVSTLTTSKNKTHTFFFVVFTEFSTGSSCNKLESALNWTHFVFNF